MKFLKAKIEDYPSIINLNNESVPHVNRISSKTLSDLHEQAFFSYVAVAAEDTNSVCEASDENVVGFLLALDESARYQSVNYQYFKQHYRSFIYVDRIIVSKTFHRRGIGSGLYQRLFQTIGMRKPLICCEVNLQPPNPQSMQFHKEMGFAGVANQTTENGSKQVNLMIRQTESETV
ncbi:GNAT family N-acetyltransferase [bacterium]|nr:GNAT family N-acetyltransferase [bacterium]